DHLSKHIDFLDKALAMNPRDAIVLRNLAESTFHKGLGTIVANDIDLRLLRRTGDLSLLSFLTKDKDMRKQWADKVRKNVDVEQALVMFDKLLVLSSKEVGIYVTLASIYGATDDAKEFGKVVERMQAAKLELADLERQTRENYEGKHDTKRLQETKGSLIRA